MFDKHYSNEGFSYRVHKVDKVVTVRLSEEELNILDKFYKGKTLSYAIRSAIHELERSRNM